MNICIFNIFTAHALKMAIYSEEALNSISTDGLIQRKRIFSLTYKANNKCRKFLEFGEVANEGSRVCLSPLS